MLFRLIFIFFLTSSYVWAEQSPLSAQQWLENMSQAMKALKYHGTVNFAKNNRFDTMKYFHSIDEGHEQEKLLSLNSPMREVIREAGIVRCVFKDTNKIVINDRPVSQSFIVDLPSDFSDSSAVYHFSLGGEESIAMQPTQVISIEAKDKFRYRRKIWIDKQYFLPLKVQVYDLNGKTLEHVAFTDIQVEQVNESADTVTQRVKTPTRDFKKKPSSDDEADFILKYIPPGFKIVFFLPMNKDDSTQAVDHLLLSDGFSSISIYREKKADDAKNGLQTLGSVNSFTHIIANDQLTAMGEVPAKTVQFIAQGVQFR